MSNQLVIEPLDGKSTKSILFVNLPLLSSVRFLPFFTHCYFLDYTAFSKILLKVIFIYLILHDFHWDHNSPLMIFSFAPEMSSTL